MQKNKFHSVFEMKKNKENYEKLKSQGINECNISKGVEKKTLGNKCIVCI